MTTDIRLATFPWRVGHTGRMVYAQIGDDISDDDVLIGVMDTPELAAEACAAHNGRLAARDAARPAARWWQ